MVISLTSARTLLAAIAVSAAQSAIIVWRKRMGPLPGQGFL
jgi:hypothetical protein